MQGSEVSKLTSTCAMNGAYTNKLVQKHQTEIRPRWGVQREDTRKTLRREIHSVELARGDEGCFCCVDIDVPLGVGKQSCEERAKDLCNDVSIELS